MDPRLKGVTLADLQEQFGLAVKIRDRTSAANEAVIRIREVRGQVEDRLQQSNDRQLAEAAERLLAGIGAVEEDLYQVRNRSRQDPLNFPIKLNNRLASLRRSVENGDARPTDAAYVVFEELAAELDAHLVILRGQWDSGLAELNRILRRLGLEPVSAESTDEVAPGS